MYDEADVEGGCAVRPCTMCCRREGPHRLRTAHPSASPVPHAVCCALCRPARLPRYAPSPTLLLLHLSLATAALIPPPSSRAPSPPPPHLRLSQATATGLLCGARCPPARRW
ncbi:hypothetical protein ACQJBY_059921 [Aegilops geniculata]